MGESAIQALAGQNEDERLELMPTSRLIGVAHFVTSDPRVAGSSPAGCKINDANELNAILAPKSPSFCTVTALILP